MESGIDEPGLPGEEGGALPVAGLGQFEELAAAGDEGRVQIEFGGALVASFAERDGAAADGEGMAFVFVADFVGELFRGDGEGFLDGAGKALATAGCEVTGKLVGDGAPTGGGGGEFDEGVGIEDVKGRAIGAKGLLFAPVPEGTEDGEAEAVEGVGAADAPDQIGIGRLGAESLGDDAGAGLAVPFEAAEADEFRLELFLKRLEVAGIGLGIGGHAGREGALSPVGLLGAFLEFEAEKLVDQVGEAEAVDSEKPRGGHGIEDARGFEAPGPVHQAEVVVGAVENEAMAAEDAEEGIQIEFRQGIDEEFAARMTELEETELLGVGVEAVGFRVDGDP